MLSVSMCAREILLLIMCLQANNISMGTLLSWDEECHRQRERQASQESTSQDQQENYLIQIKTETEK